MKKNKLVVSLVVMIAVFSLSLWTQGFADQNSISTMTTKIDGFEEENSWVIKFSGMKDTVWRNKATTFGLQQEEKQSEQSNNTTNNNTPNNDANVPQQNAQNNDNDANTPQQNAQNSTDNKQNKGNDQWIKWFSLDSFPVYEQSLIIPVGVPAKERATEKKVLGIKAAWTSKTYNWVAIEPKKELYTPNNPASIDLWVWGSYYDYDVILVVQNSEGYYYNLYLGNLQYYGWKRLSVSIPSYVYPKNLHNMNTRLRIVRIKVMTHPGSDIQGFYAYFDYMQVQHRIDLNESNTTVGLGSQKW